MSADLPIIVIELVLVLGGTLAFGWWQLRDVKRAQARRRAEEAARPQATQPDTREGSPAADADRPRSGK